MARSLLRPLEDFLSLFYPNLCFACGENLLPNQISICLKCQYLLPKTMFHEHRENAFTERFWGRIPLVGGAALYHFVKGGRTQRLIHCLKYDNKREIGIKLGQLYGRQLRESPFFKDIDLILPVPLHPKKMHLRGYNQSALFAKGLSETMKKPFDTESLVRNVFTATQTQKSRMDRFENVINAFYLKDPAKLAGKHLLLVDDVITTGATLEACGLRLLEVNGACLSMATIGFAG